MTVLRFLLFFSCFLMVSVTSLSLGNVFCHCRFVCLLFSPFFHTHTFSYTHALLAHFN
jgi:hypothetical protein